MIDGVLNTPLHWDVKGPSVQKIYSGKHKCSVNTGKSIDSIQLFYVYIEKVKTALSI